MVSVLVIGVSPTDGKMHDVSSRHRPAVIVLVLGVVVAACGSAEPPGAGSADPSEAVASAEPAPTDPPASSTAAPPSVLASTAPSAAGVMLTQPWATADLTDVRSGQVFRVADLVADGKVVFLEPMAIWCSKCKDQQRAARDAFAAVDPEEAVWIGLDVELSESAANLAKYADLNDFPFTYAVSSVELSRALAAEFGDGVLSPPNVNVVVVAPDGSVDHMTGHHEPGELVAIATGAGG